MAEPQFWLDNSPYLIGAAVVIIAGALAIKKMAPGIRRVVHLVDDLTGEPERPGVPGRPGVMERLHQLDARTAELSPNGGESIKDRVTRIDTRMTEISGRLRAVELQTCPSTPEGES
jgi:hypothetical protein